MVNDDLDVIISIAPQWETVQVIKIPRKQYFRLYFIFQNIANFSPDHGPLLRPPPRPPAMRRQPAAETAEVEQPFSNIF